MVPGITGRVLLLLEFELEFVNLLILSPQLLANSLFFDPSNVLKHSLNYTVNIIQSCRVFTV